MDTYAAASTIYHFFNTHKADGTPITLAGTPGIDIYKDNGTTQDADDSGLTLTVDFDGVTGLHLVAIDTSSDGTFYATGHVFNVVLSAGTVDSVSVVGTTVYQFKLGEVPADAVKISGDSTAADNLEDFYEETTAIGNLIDMYDGTGYAGGTIQLKSDATLNATQGSYAPAKAGDAMDLIADAIKKTTFDESTAFPLLSADTGATAVARTGADADTLETLSDQIDGAALEATLTAIKGAGWSTETLAAIDALIDAVKAKSDLIPASPAAVGSAMTLTAAYDAAKTAAPTGAAMTLTSAYDAAKTAAAAGAKMDIVDAPNATGLAAIADAFLKRDWTSVTGEATRSVLNALRPLLNKWTSASGAGGYVVKKEDDSTTAWTGTLTVDENGNISGMDHD